MSENYIVSARKYRPQTFDTVVGQEHITTTLKNAIRHQHLAHAYLFCGPRGVGKTTCARILARTINCEQPTPEVEACGVCATCRSFSDNTSFNIFELDAASNNSVDDIRSLTDQVRFAPQQGKYKIYIIDEVHMLSASAFNAFLKTLEEPPPYAIFILATTEKHKILPTILSRCQIFDFKRIVTGDIVHHLQSIAGKEQLQADEASLHIIAQKSEGCMRDALSMLDRIASFTSGRMTYSNTMEHLNLLDADFYFLLLDHALAQDVSGTLLLLDQVLEKGFEGDVVLNGLAEHLRNLLLCKDQRMAKLLDVPNEHKRVYYEKANQVPPSFILSALSAINQSQLEYRNATNKRLHTELCLIRICYLLQATAPGGLQAPAGDTNEVKKNSRPVTETAVPENSRPAAPEVSHTEQPLPQKADKPAVTKGPAAVSSDTGVAAQKPAITRRVSRNLIDDIDTVPTNTDNVPSGELTRDMVASVFDQFREEARQNNRSVLYGQLIMMKTEVIPPDEVKIISPSEMTNEYALNHRNEMIEYFRKHTGVMVRVTTEVQIDPSNPEPVRTVLSKTEIYNEMAGKNPNLNVLKEGLNLQIDF